MGGAAGSGDDDFDTALFGADSVFKKQIGRAVGGDHARFMWNTEGGEGLGGVLHGFPVGGGTHDDADERCVEDDDLRFDLGSHCVSSTVGPRYIVPQLVDKSAAFIFDHRA